jgi:hypothetical protein
MSEKQSLPPAGRPHRHPATTAGWVPFVPQGRRDDKLFRTALEKTPPFAQNAKDGAPEKAALQRQRRRTNSHFDFPFLAFHFAR